jgi:hypothetical protein
VQNRNLEEEHRGAEAVQGIAAANWPDFAGTEHPRIGDIAEDLGDDPGVVVCLGKHVCPPTGTGEQKRTLNLSFNHGELVVQVFGR